MSDAVCPVNDTIVQLQAMIDAAHLVHPKSRRRAEDILALLNDVAWGRAGSSHLPAIQGLARELLSDAEAAAGDGDAARRAGRLVQEALTSHAETFQSHVETHNCLSGACIKLTPAPCQTACPAGIDVPTYVTLIGMGRYAEAIEIIRRDNPFPWVCGLVCTRPCEFMCVRGRIDTPVSIKSLKAFAAEQALSEGSYTNPPQAPPKNRKVAVIGAGPGGMSAAYYLALKGYQVSVLEALPSAGGMMLVGIPRYRLPREVIDREVGMLEDLGIEFRFNTRFGQDVMLEDLKTEGFDAFLLTIGAHTAYKLNIPGETNYPGVIDSIHFLRRVALGERHIPGKRVVIIGGGNVAIDAARTSLRLGCPSVTVAYRRTRAEMPADEEEVLHAEEEGVRFSFLTIPLEIVGQEGRLSGIRCIRAVMQASEDGGRKFPVPVEGSEFIMEADAVIPAIGQQVDVDCLASMEGLNWTRRNTLEINRVSMQTSMEGFFAAGDAVLGPATVIEAIGGGKKAAEAIDRYLSGIPQPNMPPVPVRRGRLPCMEISASQKMTLKRPEMPMLNNNRRRIMFQQAELGYSEAQVKEEALRCLRCDICMRCGRCVEVCRDRMQIDALKFGHLNFDNPVATDFRITQENCITCGACATNCPNQALEIVDRDGERSLLFCGTILNRLKLEYCENCQAVLGPARYHDYIRQRTNGVVRATHGKTLCEKCARGTAMARSLDVGGVPLKREVNR